MILNGKIIKKIEHSYGKVFPGDLKKYLLVKYGEGKWTPLSRHSFEFLKQ